MKERMPAGRSRGNRKSVACAMRHELVLTVGQEGPAEVLDIRIDHVREWIRWHRRIVADEAARCAN